MVFLSKDLGAEDFPSPGKSGIITLNPFFTKYG